ncbi:MAG TPA: glycoside hydrolase family 44 protein [Opitutales bacterium]|mgnify:CR=1 FL=1|nr:glycoside hydrolase family 44 protein [Opitutales bacterium]
MPDNLFLRISARLRPIAFQSLAAAFVCAGAGSAGAVDFTVDLSIAPTPISPLVYGLNDFSRDTTSDSTNYTLERLGGNRLTGYNWENNASNAGSDWYHHSDNNLVSSVAAAQQSIPAKGVSISVDHARTRGHASLVTLQLAGFVAADMNGTVSAAQVAPSSRWKQVVVRKGSAFSLTPSTGDGYVYLDEELNCLIKKYGSASEGGIAAYALDNEPALWVSTHALLHPAKATCAEIVSQGSAVAAMVKDMDPGSEVYGPVLYGWSAYVNFQDADDWTASLSNTYGWFISYYLARMKIAGNAAGVRLLDVLDVHYYPEVYANNSNGTARRITVDDGTGALADARMQAPRSFWDDTFTESSWITQYSTLGPIQLIPRLQSSIDTYYPGTKIGITEYDFGGHSHYSGGIAQADCLGIFGKHGVYAACLWGETDGFIPIAFRIFRNYDGNNSAFGDLSLSTNSPDAAGYSVYASKESLSGRIHLVAINKTASAQVANVSLENTSRVVESAEVYGFSEAGGANLVAMTPVSSIVDNAFSYTLPAHSVLHFVLEDPEVYGLQMAAGDDSSKIVLLFRTEPDTTYALQHSSDLASWYVDAGDADYKGDGGVIRVEKSLTGTPVFWRFQPVE